MQGVPERVVYEPDEGDDAEAALPLVRLLDESQLPQRLAGV